MAKTPTEIFFGNPPTAKHMPSKSEIVEYLETQTGASGVAAFVGSDTGASRATKFNVADGTVFGTFSANGTITRMNYHGFEDWTIINAAQGNLGYCAFDAKPKLYGALAQDHFAMFQARGEYYGSGNISNYFIGLDSSLGHYGTGTVANVMGVHIRDPAGTGPITQNFGLNILAQTRGASNWQLYSWGTAPSYFAGRIGIGKQPEVGYNLDVAGADGFGIRYSSPGGGTAITAILGTGAGTALVGTTTNHTTALMANGVNCLVASPDGSTRALGKFGANGATPQAKVTLPANATDAATSYALLNAIKTMLIAYGLAA